MIANVVDLHSVPKLFRGFAEKSMRESYDRTAASLVAGLDAQDYIIILPDFDGSVTRAFGLKDTAAAVGLALLDAGGHLMGTYQGSEPEAQALALLQKTA